ncbi:Hypothetical protein FKW44_000088, partial [Caligus rogercresseyi]
INSLSEFFEERCLAEDLLGSLLGGTRPWTRGNSIPTKEFTAVHQILRDPT